MRVQCNIHGVDNQLHQIILCGLHCDLSYDTDYGM